MVLRVPIKRISISIRVEGPKQWKIATPNIRTLAGLLTAQEDLIMTDLEVSDTNTNRTALKNPVVAACKAFQALKVPKTLKFRYFGCEPDYWEEPDEYFGGEEVFEWEDLLKKLG